jgi:hypothetical protein
MDFFKKLLLLAVMATVTGHYAFAMDNAMNNTDDDDVVLPCDDDVDGDDDCTNRSTYDYDVDIKKIREKKSAKRKRVAQPDEISIEDKKIEKKVKDDAPGKLMLAKFIKQFSPPEYMVKSIELNEGTIKNISSTRGFPGFYFKGGVKSIDRVINAERLRNFIKEHKLDCLDVAKKYVYKVNGRLCVFAEQIVEHPDKIGVLNVREIAQLVEFVKETGYKDINLRNIIRRASDRKLVMIDTEDRSFYGSLHGQKDYDFSKINYLETLIAHTNLQKNGRYLFHLDKDARKWLKSFYDLYQVSGRGDNLKLPLSYSTEPLTCVDNAKNSVEIDFELVKEALNLN